MVGFVCDTVGEKDWFQEQAGGKRENGDSGPRSDVHTQHRRSKSASDRNIGIPRGRVLGSRKKDKNETQVSSPSTSASTGQSPWQDNPIYLNKNMSSNHRASLEKDIEQLQLRLQEEKSMRNMLERAMGRASSTLSPGHRHFSVQIRHRVPVLEKTSMLRTLKEHLHQCPSKLAEEMVRCMSLVYCWLCSSASKKIEKNPSPLQSRSSTKVLQPLDGTEDAQNWSGKSMVEISWISTDKRKSSHASYAINNYRMLVEQLEKVDVTQMELNAQIAFWINVYNALLMHAYLAYGIPNSSLRRLALFHKAAYNIGGVVISANAIEQSIFGFQTPRIGWWLETFLSTALRKKFGEDKQLRNSKLGLPVSEPLVCFALCTGAFSDPALKVYTASNVRDELEEAKKEFIRANVVVKMSRKVLLPKMLEKFSREASFSSDDLLKWVTDNVDKKLQDSIRNCIGHKSSKKPSHIIEWLPYNSRFRYVFPKDLAEKPWWF